MKNRYLYVAVLLALAALLLSCEKPPGPGGRATVTGKVYAYDYDNTQMYFISEGYTEGEKVYIVYGDGNDIGGSTVTSYDGSFKFKFLNKGHYKVFVNALDTAHKIKGNHTHYSIIKEFDITTVKQTVDLGEIKMTK